MSETALKNLIRIALEIAAKVAKITQSTTDDSVVAFLQQMQDNAIVWSFLSVWLKLVNDTVPKPPAPNPNPNGLVLLSATEDAEKPRLSAVAEASLPAGVSADAVNTVLAEYSGELKGMSQFWIDMLINLVMSLLKWTPQPRVAFDTPAEEAPQNTASA